MVYAFWKDGHLTSKAVTHAIELIIDLTYVIGGNDSFDSHLKNHRQDHCQQTQTSCSQVSASLANRVLRRERCYG